MRFHLDCGQGMFREGPSDGNLKEERKSLCEFCGFEKPHKSHEDYAE